MSPAQLVEHAWWVAAQWLPALLRCANATPARTARPADGPHVATAADEPAGSNLRGGR